MVSHKEMIRMTTLKDVEYVCPHCGQFHCTKKDLRTSKVQTRECDKDTLVSCPKCYRVSVIKNTK